jgi:uncharacterized repeat protein (TIGR01451 family)
MDKAPQGVVGQPSVCEVRVVNRGNGPAHNVTLKVQLAAGLDHAQGSQLAYQIGTLDGGAARRVQVPVTGHAPGKYRVACVAMVGKQSAAEAEAQLALKSATLELAVEGPKLRFVDRKASYVVKVHNPGPVAVDNVQLAEAIPSGFRFVEASSGGSFDRASRQVAWFVGRLEANETISVGVELIATEPGEHRLAATVKSDSGASGKAEATTKVEGTSTVVLDVVETDDPVEVAGETMYQIRVTNQGTQAARKVQVAAVLPPEVKLVQAKGATAAGIDEQQIVFQPLQSLAPGRTEIFEVRVKCQQPGNVRFRAYLRTEESRVPVVEEETTRIYSDHAE